MFMSEADKLILASLSEIRELLVSKATLINAISKEEYFQKTLYRYDGNVLYLYSEIFDLWEPASIRVQEEHEAWQRANGLLTSKSSQD